MPNIVITEKDLTSPGVLAEDFDVVYVPGFVNLEDPYLHDEDNTYIGLEYGKPRLFTSVDEFKALCGNSAAVFKEDQTYRGLNGVDTLSFDPAAVPVDGVMFPAGAKDPGYIFAIELLSQGLNVLYERMNDDSEDVLMTNIPTIFTEGVYSKLKFNKPAYKLVKDPVPPTYEPGKYYLLNRVTGLDMGNPIKEVINGYLERLYPITSEEAPSDWYELYTQCYSEQTQKVPVTLSDIKGVAIGVTSGNIEYDEWQLSVSGDGTSASIKTNTGSGVDVYLKCLTEKVGEEDTYTLVLDSGEGTNFELSVVDSPESHSNIVIGRDTYKILVYDENGELSEVTAESGTSYANVVLFNTNAEAEGKFLAVSSQEDEGSGSVASFIERWSGYDITDSDQLEDGVRWFTENVYQTAVDKVTIKNMYKELARAFDTGNSEGLVDRGNYSVKYLTSGGYPTYEYNKGSLVTAMLNIAADRGDCVALIDHTDNIDREPNINLDGSLYRKVVDDQALSGKGDYGTMFTPWASYNRVTTDYVVDEDDELQPVSSGPVRMPASFAYLTALADSLKTNAPWLAIAGSARGSVLNLAQDGMTTVIPNGVADKMQPRENGIAINAITNIRPYGETIWGNRTLKRNETNLVATSFLNIRNLVSDVKKVCYRTARKLTFEQNNEILWLNFKAEVSPTLDRMVSGYGLSGYKIVRNTAHEKAKEKATLCVKIYLYPVYPVEDFYIDIVLKDDEITVE